MTESIRIATFNVAFDRRKAGQLNKQLGKPYHPQIKKVAEIIQRVRPDILLLNEFDHDGVAKNTQGIKDFIANYLNVSQQPTDKECLPIDYGYFYLAPTNTGLLAEVDINNDGKITLPGDGYGFGDYHGQYGFVLLSRYPLDIKNARSFQQFLWKAMPDAALPVNADGSSYYSAEVLEQFRLSSKNHIDLPVNINGKTIHLLAMHPTPPIFQGAEQRSGRRNHDEIRLFADYIDHEKSAYLVDDAGQASGLADDQSFVLLGDFNADPVDGDSFQNSIMQLLQHPKINRSAALGELTPKSAGGGAAFAKSLPQLKHRGNPAHCSHIFPLRLDYVLPSVDLNVLNSGVYWYPPEHELGYLFSNQKLEQGKSVASDHRLVWLDIQR
ncbi:endonuclease/exonuclease/phosphatase family protein [Pelagibaculum spongiae]|uniref:Endonuclease/exonuclease/phosphatase family protein n=1 Tax=Pelagibaculum spongiae TaxID=2080658 RepID=A0A2V1GTS6_9GAMM|nr:endonuclease/exonuclease/phosphatase family protein [Pelagibaculum spongiae]PVZ68414.1 endonuclease/exonuclease/phosphatase family protein [Pelagibaculum spongiae]